MKISSFEEAKNFIYEHINSDPSLRFTGNFGLRRQAYLLKLLNNPQNKLKIIHIAGTSGKGSTAYYISNLLEKSGIKVSLTLSPHLKDIRERIQINNSLISKDDFVKYLNLIIPAIDQMKKSEFKTPSYFEILIALFFYFSYKNKVDYAVVESGLGGTYDGTNTISRKDKLCVITRIGYDHMEVLGKTIKEIAGQKAGIIHDHNQVVTIHQEKEARLVIEKRSKETKGQLIYVKKKTNYDKIRIEKNKVYFDYRFNKKILSNLQLNTNASYQAENCSLALTVFYYLSKRDNFIPDETKIRQCLKSINFIGRMESVFIKNKTLILDGAHNPQKMKSFIDSLRLAYPNKKFSFLIAFREGKDFRSMIDYIIPVATKIILTDYVTTSYDMVHHSVSPEIIVKYFKKKKFHNYEIIRDKSLAIDQLIKYSEKTVVITGSFYLLSTIYPILTI